MSIQSLILVSEPYFNEPGYERSRGTPSGTAASREYDANIRQATVKWAMLEMLRNPPEAFSTVIRQHFYLKRTAIMRQVSSWIQEMQEHVSDKTHGRRIAHSLSQLKKFFQQLREELEKLEAPEQLSEDLHQQCSMPNSAPCSSGTVVSSASPSTSLSALPSATAYNNYGS